MNERSFIGSMWAHKAARRKYVVLATCLLEVWKSHHLSAVKEIDTLFIYFDCKCFLNESTTTLAICNQLTGNPGNLAPRSTQKPYEKKHPQVLGQCSVLNLKTKIASCSSFSTLWCSMFRVWIFRGWKEKLAGKSVVEGTFAFLLLIIWHFCPQHLLGETLWEQCFSEGDYLLTH